MTIRYLAREIESEIKRAAREFPVVVLTGPRQTGKSTLLGKLFPRHRVAPLDDRLTQKTALEDPDLFFENFPPPVLIDEIQHVPQLLPLIKMRADEHRRHCGRFILTGSQVFPLMSGIAESLAGRAALFELLGFSWKELGNQLVSAGACFDRIFKGFYPDPAVHGVSPKNFYGAYIKTYLERDIRQIQSVQDLALFHGFLELLAARTASLLNLNEISKECGISHTTARQWLSLLESTRIVYLLRPYHKNISKRVVKSPKLYFTDTGLLAHLLKYPDSRTLEAGPMGGAFFENMIVLELLKAKFNRNSPAELYFFRDSNHNEVDLIIESGKGLVLAEIKTARSLRTEFADTMTRVMKNFNVHSAHVISMAPDEIRLTRLVSARHWSRAADLIY